MTLELLSDADARANFKAPLFHARVERNLLHDFRLISVRVMMVVLVLLPVLRGDVWLLNLLPYWLALLIVVGLFFYNRIISKDLKEVRRASSWVMNASREALFVKFLSYRRDPEGREVVLGIPAEDVAAIHQVRSRRDDAQLLDITFQTEIPEAIIRAIAEADEPEAPATAWPLKNRRTLRVNWADVVPDLSRTLDKLRLYYHVDPARVVSDPDQDLLM